MFAELTAGCEPGSSDPSRRRRRWCALATGDGPAHSLAPCWLPSLLALGAPRIANCSSSASKSPSRPSPNTGYAAVATVAGLELCSGHRCHRYVRRADHRLEAALGSGDHHASPTPTGLDPGRGEDQLTLNWCHTPRARRRV